MRIVAGFLLLAGSALAQEYRKHNLYVDMGAGQPRAELRGLFNDSFLTGIGYGYRFHEYFQADIGFETMFGAAGVRDFQPSFFGDLRIRDYQHFLPFGGRVVLPIARDRVQVYGGGGGAYIRYAERIRQPFQDSSYRIDCITCRSRDGIGYYASAGVNVAIDSARRFRIGAGGRVYRGGTGGDPFGAVTAPETRDHWVNVFGSFTVSF